MHFVSSERGIVYYTPVLFLALLGISAIRKQNKDILAILLGVVGANVLLYSMWGDPWGGWAFGSRYLIPVYAILSIFLALALSRHRKSILVIITFFLLLIYSISVNTLGALTTSRIPPKGEAKALEPISGRQEKFSFDRNIDFLIKEDKSKSFIYQTYVSRYIPAWKYYLLVFIPLISAAALLTILLRFKKGEENV